METRLRKTNYVIIPANFLESIRGPAVVDHQNPAIKVILQEEEILGWIVDGSSGLNVINKATWNLLGKQF